MTPAIPYLPGRFRPPTLQEEFTLDNPVGQFRVALAELAKPRVLRCGINLYEFRGFMGSRKLCGTLEDLASEVGGML